ncbi:NUDIX domain-containing protein [Benzoatithermus flavus]|uniref:NUDIX hydrolase n=1 Tax=Benzoatithermus flavus TaxID=3108223 RepID=A0ABU8XYA2_9PROT
MDALFRLGYRTAFRVLRLWWRVRRPVLEGAAVAVWHDGRLLVVKTSYHDRLDLPGGGRGRGEAPRAAAARELLEETGIEVPPAALVPAGRFRFEDLRRRITDHVFAWHPAEAPVPLVDRREIVWAGWLAPDEIAAAPLTPTLRLYLASRAFSPAKARART